MFCHQCGKETRGTETSPGTVSSICPPCNVLLTGKGHHEHAYDVNPDGTKVSAPPANEPKADGHKVARRRRKS